MLKKMIIILCCIIFCIPLFCSAAIVNNAGGGGNNINQNDGGIGGSDNGNSYQKYACAFTSGLDSTNDETVIVLQNTDGMKSVYINNPVGSDSALKFKWEGGRVTNLDEIWKTVGNNDAWVKITNYVWYKPKSDETWYSSLSEQFQKVYDRDWDLADYCNNEKDIYRYFDGLDHRLGAPDGNPYLDKDTGKYIYPENIYKDVTTTRYFIISDWDVYFSSSTGTAGARRFTNIAGINISDEGGSGDGNNQPNFEDVTTIETYNKKSYDEYKNEKYATNWKLYCEYGSFNQVQLEMFISKDSLLLFYPYSKISYPSATFTFDDVKNLSACPSEIYFTCTNDKNDVSQCTFYLSATRYSNSFELLYSDSGFVKTTVDMNLGSNDCEGILGRPEDDGSVAYYLQMVFNIMKYVAIILLIGLTIMDFVGAITSHDDDQLKKATSKAITRLIICVILFVLPTIIEFLMKVLDVYGDAGGCKIR